VEAVFSSFNRTVVRLFPCYSPRMDPREALPLHPTIGPQPAERSDAARNRAKLIATARRIIDLDGVEGLTMDRLATEAGVGKGTVFRRFGSRAGLCQTLLDDVERDFQGRFLSGPPPLGPGAPPLERLVAFGRARIDTLWQQGALLRAAEVPTESHFEVPARKVVELHLVTLLREAGATGDLPVLAFNLLSVLEGILLMPPGFGSGRAGASGSPAASPGFRIARFADGWEDLVRRLLS
jgi:AcrR family transcriptional regulator